MNADLLSKVYSLPYPVGIWTPKNDAHGVATMRGVGGIPLLLKNKDLLGSFTANPWHKAHVL